MSAPMFRLLGTAVLGVGLSALGSPEGVARAEPDLYGRFSIDSVYGVNDNGGTDDSRLELLLIPRLELDEGGLLAVGEVEIRRDRADPGRDRARIRRLVVDRRVGPVAVTIGNQVVAWGQMDAIRPVDRFNPHDYTDLLDDVVLEVPALRARGERNGVRVDAVVAPAFQVSELSTSRDSAWYPLRGATFVDPATGEPIPAELIRLGDGDRTAMSAEALSAGVRVGTTLAGVDLALSYFNGPDHLPVTYRPEPDGAGLALVPVTPRQNVFGVDFATTLGRVVVRGEAAYVLTDDVDARDPLVDDPYLQAALGGEWQADGFGHDHVVVLLAELHLDREVGGHGPENSEDLPSLRHYFQQAGVVNATYRIGFDWSLSMSSFYGIDTGDLLVGPAIEWRPEGGDLSVELRGHVLSSSAGSLFAPYEHNDRVGLRVRLDL